LIPARYYCEVAASSRAGGFHQEQRHHMTSHVKLPSEIPHTIEETLVY